MSEDSQKPRRRWFSFSLRTLFLVLTTFSLWLGWHFQIARVVQQRNALRQQARLSNGRRTEPRFAFYNDFSTSPLLATKKDYEDVQSLKVGSAVTVTSRSQDKKDHETFQLLKEASSPPSVPRDIPRLRKWLADRPVDLIVVQTQQDHDLARLRFPEAYVYLMPPPRERTRDP